MAEWNKKAPFDFGITLGDNFYPAGMASPTDTRWKSFWDELYDPLKIKVYASLGNHDWVLSDSPGSEHLSPNSPRWRRPSLVLSRPARSVLRLDTMKCGAQLMARRRTAEEHCKMEDVYNHPIYSDGEHGDSSCLPEASAFSQNRGDVYR